MSDRNPAADLDTRLEQVAALGDPTRRALYRFVVANGGPATREQAAAGAGVALHVAKFHLDRLVDDGLLAAEYRRPAGRNGPGAGRPAKVYRRADVAVEVSLPERRYDFAARLLAKAVARASGDDIDVAEAVCGIAAEAGRSLGESAGRRRGLAAVAEVLAGQGYEPGREGKCLILRNCPFHTVANEETELICGMNQALVGGVLDGMGADSLEAVLDPTPNGCCVRIQPR